MPDKNTPLVSVIIPTYNRATELCRALDSVLAQTYKNYEVVIVDDGSTDDTRERIATYMKDPRIRYIYQENQRQAAARNRGIRESKGELIAFLDSDDEWAPMKLERQVPALTENPEIGMVYCNQLVKRDRADPGVIRYAKGVLKSGYIFESLLRGEFYCSTQGVVVPRAVINKVGGFDDALANALEDWEWTLRIAYRYQVAVVDEPLVVRYVNESYSPSYTPTRVVNHRRILDKVFRDCEVQRGLRKYVWKRAWFSWGHKLLVAGYYWKSLKCLVKAVLLGNPSALALLPLTLMGRLGREVLRLTENSPGHRT